MIARNPLVRWRDGREQLIEHIAGTVEDEQQTREEDPQVNAALAVARMQPAVDAGALGRSARAANRSIGLTGSMTASLRPMSAQCRSSERWASTSAGLRPVTRAI